MHASRKLFHLSLAAVLVLGGCRPTASDTPTSDASQSEPAASSTPEPTDTISPEPTRIPLPRIESDPMLTEHLNVIRITTFDDGSSLDNWYENHIGSNYAYSNNGLIEIVGKPNWEGGISWKFANGILRSFQGGLFKLRFTGNADYQINLATGLSYIDSNHQELSFLIFGGSNPKVESSQGLTDFKSIDFKGNLSLVLDKWYMFMFAIGDNGEFLARVWDPEDTSLNSVLHATIFNNSSGKDWELWIAANDGADISMDSFVLFDFDSIK